MKQILRTLLFLFILSCIIFSATAQTNISKYYTFKHSNEQLFTTPSLPTNRAAFIFSNSNSEYTNPAVALLYTKSTNILPKTIETEAIAVSSLVVNNSNKITEEDICMYPNITEDELWININNQTESTNQKSVEIYNSTGERVYHSTINANLHKINLCEFTAGTFLIKLDDNVQKIIIE